MKKIVLCGGGTAGHVIPNIAIIPFLSAHFDEIHYIGSEGGIEKALIERIPGVKYHEIKCAKLRRKLTLKNLAVPFRLLRSISDAKKLIRQIAPTVVFSKGGYASLPVVFASKAPVLAHESDMTLGLSNKLIKKRCKNICCTFLNTAKKLSNGIYTGSPIRQELYNGNKTKIIAECAFRPDYPTLLIMGGSLGSRAINSAVFSALPELCRRYNVLHLTGKGNNEAIDCNGYRAFPYRSDMADIFAAADIVVSRGGSNALCEILALKKPALIIPLPKSESRGDQLDNAGYYRKRSQIAVLMQDKLNAATLVSEIDKVYGNRQTLINNISNNGALDGTRTIANMLIKYGK